MKKQTFVDIIKAIQGQQQQDHKTTDCLINVLADSGGFYTTKLTVDIVTILEREFNDTGGTISWWLWDAPNAGKNSEACTIEHNGKKWHLTDAGKLYDYVCMVKDTSAQYTVKGVYD